MLTEQKAIAGTKKVCIGGACSRRRKLGLLCGKPSFRFFSFLFCGRPRWGEDDDHSCEQSYVYSSPQEMMITAVNRAMYNYSSPHSCDHHLPPTMATNKAVFLSLDLSRLFSVGMCTIIGMLPIAQFVALLRLHCRIEPSRATLYHASTGLITVLGQHGTARDSSTVQSVHTATHNLAMPC